MDTNENFILADIDLSGQNIEDYNLVDFFKKIFNSNNILESKVIRFESKKFQTKSNHFELNNLAIHSQITSIGYIRRADQLHISATEQDFMNLALLLFLSLFKQEKLTIQLNHKNSFIKKIILEPIEFYQFNLNINHIDYSSMELYEFIEELLSEKQQLEFLQTIDEGQDEYENFDWNLDRKVVVIRGDFFRIYHTASLLLNFLHPLNTIDELELTGSVGYQEHLTGLSANINLWKPNSFGYFLNDE